jgi:hypothetical protein
MIYVGCIAYFEVVASRVESQNISPGPSMRIVSYF